MKKRRLGLGSAIIASLLLSSCANTGYIRESSVSSNKPIRNYSLVSKYILPTPAKKVINVPLTLYLPDPVSLDSKLSKKRIKNLEFQGPVSLLAITLGKMGIPCIVGKQAGKLNVTIGGFSGTFGQLAESLSKTYGLIFKESGKTVNIEQMDSFSVSLISLPMDFNKMLLKQLKQVGLFKNLSYSPYTQSLSWKGNAKSIYSLNNILQNLISNYARIDFDIVIFESSTNNLNEFSLGLSSTKASGQSWNVVASSGNTNSIAAYFNAGISTNTFNSLIHLLYQKNKGVVLQKIFLSTANFEQGEISEGNKIPYIESVTETFVTDSNNNTVPEYSITFNDALSGVKMKISPVYVKDLNSVFANVDVNVQDVIKMVDVNAGSYRYERPQTSTKSIKTKLIMRLGKIYIFGGFLLSKIDKTNSVLPIQWKNDKDNVYLFVAIRPTVEVFGEK